MNYRIGVDAGGTHVVANAYDKDHQSLSSATEESGNIFINPQQAVTNISSAIMKVAVPNQNCEKILVGIAGLESTISPDLFLDQIREKVATICTNCIFVSDAKLALINGLKGQDGFLVIAGTGSIVYGKQNEHYLRAGGWGYLLDDIGSGYRISQEAVTKLLQTHDAGKKCSYQSVIFHYFKVNTIQELISKYYNSSRTEIAGCASTLAQAATDENPNIINIFEHQGKLLANEILTLINRYPLTQINYNLALSGSVLVHNSIVQNAVKQTVLNKFPQMKVTISVQNNNMAVNYI